MEEKKERQKFKNGGKGPNKIPKTTRDSTPTVSNANQQDKQRKEREKLTPGQG